MKIKIVRLLSMVVLVPLVSLNTVNAALLTNVYFNQELLTANRESGVKFHSLAFTGGELPATGGLFLAGPDGGFISTAYKFSDTGSTAIFDIQALYTVKDRDLVSSQSVNENDTPILFMTTQPVFYTISVMQNVLGSTDPIPGTATFAILSGGSGNIFDIREKTNDESDYMAGSLLANTSYSFTTLIEAALPHSSGIMSGQSHINLTVTSIEAGLSADNPLLPTGTHEGWDFNFNSHLNEKTYIDPIVATGYDYLADSGAKFASVLLPSVGDDEFALYLWNNTGWFYDSTLTSGIEHFFSGSGVDRFRISGIETSAALDPNDATAFVTGLTFVDAGPVNMHMIPITAQEVPEPQSYALLLLAGLAMAPFIARRHRTFE